MKPTPLDKGNRHRFRGSYPGIDPALDDLCDIIDSRPEGWRVRLASLKCPTDRGQRVSMQVEVVSPKWVADRRQSRRNKQRKGNGAQPQELVRPGQ